MSCSRSRWQGWKTAGRAAADRVVPAHAEDRGRPPANPATAQMQSRQPPSRLPPQESDIRRFENPLSEQPLHFNPLVLQSGLTPPPLSVEQPWSRAPAPSANIGPPPLGQFPGNSGNNQMQSGGQGSQSTWQDGSSPRSYSSPTGSSQAGAPSTANTGPPPLGQLPSSSGNNEMQS